MIRKIFWLCYKNTLTTLDFLGCEISVKSAVGVFATIYRRANPWETAGLCKKLLIFSNYDAFIKNLLILFSINTAYKVIG